MLKKKLLSLFLLCLVITPMMSANSYRDRGLYGKLSYLYIEDEYLNMNSKSSTQQGTQTFMIGYAGNIYSPRLFAYTLEGTMRYDDSKRKNDNSDSSTIKSDSQDYRINMNFINGSKFPFSVSLSERNSVVGDSIYTTEQKSINGRMNFDPLNFNYGASKSSSISEYGNTIGVNEYDNYNAGINYKKDAHNINIRYLHTEQSYNQKYEDYNLTTYRDDLTVDDKLNVDYKWKISKELDFDSSGYYDVDKYSSTKSTNANANLRWTPDTKYGGSISARGTRYEYKDANDSKGILDTLTINQNFRYQVMKSLSLYESASVTTYNSPISKGTSSMISLGANHHYNRDIFSDSKLRVSTGANVRQSQSKTKTTLDNNSDTRNNGNYTFNTSANIAKPLRSISSHLNLNASYRYSLNTTDSSNSASQTYGAGSSLSSTFYNFRNNFNITVFKSDSELVSSITTNVSDTINTSVRLGIRGNMNFKAGVKYYSNDTDDNSVKRTSLDAGTSVRYRFFTKLMFDMNVNIRKDIELAYLAYSGSSGLSYSTGKTSLSIKYMYNKSEYQSLNTVSEYERTSFRFNIDRSF